MTESPNKPLPTPARVVLRVLGRLQREVGAPVEFELLALEVWRRDSGRFGLQAGSQRDGLLDYPDTRKVWLQLCDGSELHRRGLVLMPGPDRFCISESGWLVLKQLGAERLPTLLVETLKTLKESPTLQKVGGRSPRLNFYDACRFWGITPRASADKLEQRLERIDQTLKLAQQLLTERKRAIDDLDQSDLEKIRTAHLTLQKKFARDLTLIRRRAARR